MGCAKTVCPSSSGNNGAFVNELRLDIVRINLKAYSYSLRCWFFFQSLALHYFFEYVNYFFLDKSRAAHLGVGCGKTVCPSSSGNNGAFVNELRLDICKNQVKCI